MIDDAQSFRYKKCQFLNERDSCTRTTMHMKAWTSKMKEHTSAIWMFQAMLCVFEKYFLLENMIFTFTLNLFINV